MVKNFLILSAISASIMGCANQPAQPLASESSSGAEPPADIQTEAPSPTPINYTDIDGKTVFRVLVAEMALDRREYMLGLQEYLNLARDTKDAGAAQRAANIGSLLNQPEPALEAAEIWIASEPKQATAYKIAAVSAIKLSEFDKAEAYLNTLLQLDHHAKIDELFGHTASFTPEQRQSALTLVQKQVELYSDNEHLWLIKARLERASNLLPEALESVNKSIKIAPGPQNYLTKVDIYATMKDNDGVTKTLEKAVDLFPYERQIVIAYASTYARMKQDKVAMPVLKQYFENHPDDHQVTSIYARMALEANQPDIAVPLFDRLSNVPEHMDEAHFFLGRIARDNEEFGQALYHLKLVTKQPYLIPASAEAMEIFYEEGELSDAITFIDDNQAKHPEHDENWINLKADAYRLWDQDDKAMETLDNAVLQYPDNENLRYGRALMADSVGKTDVLITDLEHILARDPDNARALNALGYTFADKNMRLDEAEYMINKALEMNPSDAAVLDSKGWLHYRLGDLDTALEYLQKAFDLTKNHEIAAHLGEVLWTMGNTEQAREIWNLGLEDDPNSKILERTIDRFIKN